MGERGGAFGLNHMELRQAIDQAEAKHFVEAFAQRGAIAHIPAGNDDVVRDLPARIAEEFQRRRSFALRCETD